jgi:5-methylcytosine-specific restriction endonuclease McrA
MKKKKKRRTKKRNSLRSGSKGVKNLLLAEKPYCDICGSDRSLQLHHIYLIRHGFETKLEHCCLLCPTCHAEFHARFDRYLDEIFKQNPNADFLAIYNELKTL